LALYLVACHIISTFNDTILTNPQTNKNALYQKLPPAQGSSFVVNRYTTPYFETAWHFHEEYELIYCEACFGKRFIGNSFAEFYQGEMVFIGKNVPHTFLADQSFYQPGAITKPSSIVIQFLENFLGSHFFYCPEMTGMRQILSNSMNGLMITGETNKKIKTILLSMLDAGTTGRLTYLIEIFGILAASSELHPLSVSTISGINVSDSLKMNKVLEYALGNYKENINIRDAAALMNLSESAFCRYFKSRTQKSFLGFVIEIRLNEACKLLKETDQSILDICYETGFKNLSNFNRLFKKQHNKSPLEYRKQMLA